MSTDSAPTMFPNRPIRPLPRRRLRERLSPEVAESIEYPPVTQSTSPLFSYNYPSIEDSVASGSGIRSALPREVVSDLERQTRAIGLGTESEEPGVSTPRANFTGRPALDTSGRVVVPTQISDQDEFPPLSYPSSPDGYDSFENANNKKKRKIPTAIEGGVHIVNDSLLGAGLLNRAAQSAEAHGQSLNSSSSPYYSPYHGSGGSGSGVHNVVGPGRGRYGRAKSGRSPLRPLSDSTISWSGRNGKLRPVTWTPASNESTGIISTAIANAEKLAPHQGQENISLLHQQLATKRSEASTQFTFTCDSQVPVSWSSPDRSMTSPSQPASQDANGNWQHASQTGQTGQSAPAIPYAADSGSKDQAHKVGPSNQNQPPPPPPPKNTRRSATKELMEAAKERRRERQLYNRRNPPKPEDIWICHFCEYEDIFGHPPEALIRSYEMKDRKQRQLEQQRRAQWERMKKGKHKGKRNSKLTAKNTQSFDSHGAPMNHFDQETQDGDLSDEVEYDEDDSEVEVHHHACPHVCGHHQSHHHNHHHAHHHNHVPVRSAIRDGVGT